MMMNGKIGKGLKILVIDDEPGQREILADILTDAGLEVMPAASGEQGLELLYRGDCLLVLTDLKMPGMDGLEVLQQALAYDPQIQVILMTAFGTIPSAVNAIKKGAYDYLTKPFNKADLLRVVQRAADKIALILENRQLKSQLSWQSGFHNIIGTSPAMQDIFRMIEKIKNLDATVLISGESGTGKELVARAIHYGGNRKTAPFVALNCGAIPDNLIESELFGFEKGAFTGALRATPGKFELAEGGTIFLDEISVMPLHLQTRLLRVLQHKSVSRLGSNRERVLNIRIMAATNEDLEEKVGSGLFRADLYHRLNLFSIQLPPLRRRSEDIPLLVRHFLQKFAERYHKKNLQVTPAALKRLENYTFPGNVRELENILEKTIILSESNPIGPEMLMFDENSLNKLTTRKDITTLPSMECEMIIGALEDERGSIRKASEKLGISYKTLQYRMKKFGLQKQRFKN